MRPVIPQPGFTEGQAMAVINSGQFVYADCYTIYPLVGDPIRYTSVQQDMSVVPVGETERAIYVGSRVVVITGLRVKSSVGVQVDEQQITLSYPDTPIFQASLTWAQALLQGRLDGATISRDRYVAETFGNGPAGDTLWMSGSPMFRGLVSTLSTVGRQSATVNIKSNLISLNRQAPATLFDPTCTNVWGDPICGVVQADWAVEGLIGSGSTRSVIAWVDASTDYNSGKIHISNSDDVTRVRTVARATATHLYLAYPLDFDPVTAAHFTAYPGCPRTDDATTGCPKYHGADWVKKYRGYPFTPVAETAI